jgi:histone H3/H4
MQTKDGIKTNVNTSIKSLVVKKKKSRFFETYISKVLKQLSDKHGITSNSKQQLNSALCIVSRKISSMVVRLTEIAKKKTMSDKEVSNAISIILSGDLAKNSIREGEKSVTKFGAESSKGSSRQGKAGIVFPPSIAEKFLRNFGYSKVMVTSTAPVFLASVLEYLVSEILILASKSASDNKRIRITIRDLQLSVGEDNELSDLFDKLNISFIGGGEIPYIHPCLTSKKPRKKKKVVELVQGTKKPHRFRPGTVALREIKKFQKMSNCLTFAKFPFERFVRSVVNKNKQGMKISKDVFVILQYYIEQYIVEILKDANLAAIHTGRVKLMLSDVEFICKIRGLSTDGFSDKKVKKEKKLRRKKSDIDENINTEEEDEEDDQNVEEEEGGSSSEEDNVEE